MLFLNQKSIHKMKVLALFLIASLSLFSCQKESTSTATVTFYLLGETQPFIADSSIVSYQKSNFQFVLTPMAAQKVRNNLKKDFVLKVDSTAISEGTFWSLIFSSLPNKNLTANIAPQTNEMDMSFFLDKVSNPDPRNDSRLISAMRGAGKLK
jgi:hypothetical protein